MPYLHNGLRVSEGRALSLEAITVDVGAVPIQMSCLGVDDALAELGARGHPEVRAVHEFAMRAIASGADNASELGRRLSVSKQAAAKTIAVLLERGYINRDADPKDPRRKRIEVTPLGFEMLRQAAAIFNDLRDRWEMQLAAQELAVLEAQLTTFVGASPVNLETPGWIAQSAE